jgi:type VI secretion system protein ImpH
MGKRRWNYSCKIKENLDKIADYNFFKAVRILDALKEDSIQTGEATHPLLESIRFSQKCSLKFAPQDIESCRYDSNKDYVEMAVNCFGMLGANGPLPLNFTEYIQYSKRNNTAFNEFLDIFHHRMISFFYRAWAINNQAVSYEMKNDHFLDYFYSLIGENYKSVKDDTKLPGNSKIYYAGHFVRNYRNTEALRAIVSEYFDVPAKVYENDPKWINSPSNELFKLGTDKKASRLGVDAFLGQRFLVSSLSFKLVMGPMPYNKYIKLLPGTLGHRRLCEWIKCCSPLELDCDVQLILSAEEVPKLKKGSMLGYTSWMNSKKIKNDLSNLIIKCKI